MPTCLSFPMPFINQNFVGRTKVLLHKKYYAISHSISELQVVSWSSWKMGFPRTLMDDGVGAFQKFTQSGKKSCNIYNYYLVYYNANELSFELSWLKKKNSRNSIWVLKIEMDMGGVRAPKSITCTWKSKNQLWNMILSREYAGEVKKLWSFLMTSSPALLGPLFHKTTPHLMVAPGNTRVPHINSFRLLRHVSYCSSYQELFSQV